MVTLLDRGLSRVKAEDRVSCEYCLPNEIPINDLLLSHIIGDGEADDLQVGMNLYDQLLRRHGSEEECPDNLGMGEGKKDESDIAASASVL